MKALRLANRSRLGQANYKRMLKKAEYRDVKAIICGTLEGLSNYPELQNIEILKFLRWAPGFGPHAVNNILSHAEVHPTKRLRELTDSQIQRLIAKVE
jgi:hypothetical protein